jgi:hypothetical protein
MYRAIFFGTALMMIIAIPAHAGCRSVPGPGCYYRGGQCLYQVQCEPDSGQLRGGPPVDFSIFSGAARTPFGPDLESIARMQLMQQQMRENR